MRKYKGIDAGKIIFACLIPMLHIVLPGTYIIQQYVARVGVPFFFAVSGMFLSSGMEKRGPSKAWKHYFFRVGKIFIIWLIIYTPFMLLRSELTIQRLFFLTPGYLWYLNALLVGSIPFCYVKNRKILYTVSLVLYVVGTIFGDTYKWLVGGWATYERIFLTTRNGLFFGLPLMCVGELSWKEKKGSLLGLVLTGGLLASEITIVKHFAPRECDTSLYLMLPGFVFYLTVILREWQPAISLQRAGVISTAIYLMQYGIICCLSKAFEVAHFGNWSNWLIYLGTLVIPICICIIDKKGKVINILF